MFVDAAMRRSCIRPLFMRCRLAINASVCLIARSTVERTSAILDCSPGVGLGTFQLSVSEGVTVRGYLLVPVATSCRSVWNCAV